MYIYLKGELGCGFSFLVSHAASAFASGGFRFSCKSEMCCKIIVQGRVYCKIPFCEVLIFHVNLENSKSR